MAQGVRRMRNLRQRRQAEGECIIRDGVTGRGALTSKPRRQGSTKPANGESVNEQRRR